MDRSGTDEAEGLRLDAWLALLRRVPGLEGVEVTRDEQRALLDLALVAAHRSERIAAPITSFGVGVALAGLPPADRAERIRRVVAELEGQTQAS